MRNDLEDRRLIAGALTYGVGRSPKDVARRTRLSTTRVANLLKQMVKDGAVRTAVTGEGRTTYSLN